jgi:hypothetical protein
MMAAPAIQGSLLLSGGEPSMPQSKSRGSMMSYSSMDNDARAIIDHFVESPQTPSKDIDFHSLNKGKGKETESPATQSRRSIDSKKSTRSPKNSPRKGSADLPIEETPEVPPKSPRHQTYSLPIGGGPKKVFVVSGGRRQQSTSATRFVSAASSSKSRMSGPAPSVPAIPDAHKSPRLGAQDRPFSAPVPDKPLARSVSANLSSKTAPSSPFSNNQASLTPIGRRRTLSGSDTEEAKNQQRSGAKSTAALLGVPEHTLGRRGTASSIMVEGQIFEIDGEEEKTQGEKNRILSVGSSLQPLEEDGVLDVEDAPKRIPISQLYQEDVESSDDESLHDEPVVFTDDEIDDTPPPGAYAIHPPSKNRLGRAAGLPLFDEDGNIVEFGTVFENRRTLICFLRHWLCPFCQMFSQSLQHIDPLPLETAKLDLVVVGQGHWHVTKSYKEVMKIPSWVKMYSDPSRKIYKALGMTLRTNDKGPACAKPDYQTMGIFKASMVAIKKGVIDMPLRPPGDLMLLGGEFILGPGLHCSFTHRMVTTRGHLDLPRILVQAGCDLSLKTPVDPNASPRRPISTKSVDRKRALQLARKFGQRRGTTASMAGRNEALIAKLAGDPSSSLRVLSGDHTNHQTKTLSKSQGKFKGKSPSGLRNISISHPLELNNAESAPMSRSESKQYSSSRSTSVDFGTQFKYVNAPMPPSPTTPLQVVRERLQNGMVTGFSKSQSMGDMNVVFTRPPRSAQRPQLPTTSSAAAFEAASARTSLYGSPPVSPTKMNHQRSRSGHSIPSSQTIQAQNRWQHQQMPSISTTNDSRFGVDSSIASPMSSQTSHSHLGNSSYLTPSNSIKRATKSNANIAPISALEASRVATFSSSSPSIPLSTSFPDPSRSKKSSIRSMNSDFGEDTEYKRLDRRMLDQPTLQFNGHAEESDEERDIPLNVTDQGQDDWSPSTSITHLHLSHQLKGVNGLTIEEEDELQRTPLARKISLEEREDRVNSGNNRSSIIAGKGPKQISSYPDSLASSSPTLSSPMSGSFAHNALFAALPPMQHQHQQQIPQKTNGLPTSRAPASAPAPLFAALLAEEAARTHQPYHQSNGKAVKEAEEIPVKEPKAIPMAIGSSFLGDMDVHDGFVREQSATRDSMETSQDDSTSYFDESEYEDEEEEDDWAPLRASGNVIPARLSSEGEVSPTESSPRSFFEDDEEDSMYEDEEEEDHLRAATASPLQEYELKKVTGRVVNRPSSAPVVRKVHNTPVQQSMFKQNSVNGLTTRSSRLDSFQEEEEEE